MLNEFLKVAYNKSRAEQEQAEFVDLLKQLPIEELHKIAQSGEVKLASDLMAAESKSWLDQFKGTPFMEQAVALEQEGLQAEMARQQQRSVENQRLQQGYAQEDQLRTKKKLLELQKAKAEMQTLGQAGVPVSGNLPGTDTGVTPQDPPAMPKTASGKYPALKMTAGVTGFSAATGALAGAMSKQHYDKAHKANPKSDIAAFAAKHPKTYSAALSGGTAAGLMGLMSHKPIGSELRQLGGEIKRHARKAHGRMRGAAESIGHDIKARGAPDGPHNKKGVENVHPTHDSKDVTEASKKMMDILGKGKSKKAFVIAADNAGRLLARADGEKIAHQQQLEAVGMRAGAVLAKTAGPGMEHIVRAMKANPGALIGAGVGAGGQALREATSDEPKSLAGSASRILGAGAVGGAVGHAGQHFHSALSAEKPSTLGEAATSYHAKLKDHATSMKGHYNDMLEKMKTSPAGSVQPPTP